MKFKPPAIVLDGKGNLSAILELSILTHHGGDMGCFERIYSVYRSGVGGGETVSSGIGSGSSRKVSVLGLAVGNRLESSSRWSLASLFLGNCGNSHK